MNEIPFDSVDAWHQKDPFSDFMLSLLKMEDRIRVFCFGDEEYANKSNKQFYHPTKDILFIPVGIPHIGHEIGHMVEISPDRCLLTDWGLSNFSDKEPGHKLFFAAISREIRVRAITSHMGGFCSRIFPSEHCYWGDVKDRLPFGRFKNKKDVQDWADDLHAKTFAAWSLDRIRHEWEIRLTHIQHWMETKAAA